MAKGEGSGSVALGAARLAVAAALLAAAQPARAEEQRAGDTGGALPGFVRVGAASPFDTGLVVAGLAGYGYRGAMVADSDDHHRAAIDVATSFRPLDWLAIAARFSGRYDRHTDTGEADDSGWVGDPRLAVRATLPVGGALWLAAHAGLWVPGRDAPSLDPGAATVDLLGIASWAAPGGRFLLGAQAGFRLDRSAESVDRPQELSPSDRMALGVSDSNAALFGAGVALRTGAATEWVAEWSWDVLVGDRAPGSSRWPMRAGAGVRQQLARTLGLQLLVEYSLADAAAPDAMDALYPIESRVQALAGITFQPGRARDDHAGRLVIKERGRDDAVARPPAAGAIAVEVTGASGALAGAEVVLEPDGGAARSARTGPDGRAVFSGVGGGPARVRASHPRHRAGSQAVVVEPGATSSLRIALEPAFPPGQLRGLVRSFQGRPLAARLVVSPLDVETRCDPRGEFELDLPPGEYVVSIEADGYRAQRRRVVIEQDGVTILNVDLRR